MKVVFDIDARLVEGSGGVFDVHLDKRLIFSKDETGRFPENDEIVSLIRGN